MQILVIGAGVVGLAVGRALARRDHAVVVADAAGGIGSGLSSRNSGVIHAGMYYPAGSLRARHCVEGRHRLYDYCDSHAIAHRRCGKLIVAADEAEVAVLDALLARGHANGVEGLTLLDAAAVRALEPAVACRAALHSEQTGIVDAHALMLALRGEIEDAGGVIALRTPIARLVPDGASWIAEFGGAEPGTIPVDAVVNCAALGAQHIARRTEGYPADRVPRLVLAKGSYFAYAGRAPFQRLVYPAPGDGGLGIHATLDLAGRLRFGPDVEWVDTIDYGVEPGRAALFAAAIRRYWPGLRDDALLPDYAGLRPKLSGPGEPASDFVIDGPEGHGLPGLVHLFGIESPGLTSALSLAEDVADRLGARRSLAPGR